MTIALLLIAALVLMATMLFLTIGVNDLEKKAGDLAELIRKRYVIKNAPKKKNPLMGGPTPGKAPEKP